MITDQTGLHSVLLPLWVWFDSDCYNCVTPAIRDAGSTISVLDHKLKTNQ